MNTFTAFPTEHALARLDELIIDHASASRTAQAAALDAWASQPKESRTDSRDVVDKLSLMQSKADKVQAALTRAYNQLAKV